MAKAVKGTARTLGTQCRFTHRRVGAFLGILLFAACSCGLAQPQIDVQPQSQTVATGDSVTFTVVASSSSPLTYQWRFNGGNLSGATMDSLTLTGVQWLDSGNYSVVVRDSMAPVTSSNAVLTVIPPVKFTNQTAIAIAGAASPYPSVITVSNLAGAIMKVTLTLNEISHSLPDDLDILLVGPDGQRVMVMSDSGGGNAVSNLTLMFDDTATESLPDSAPILPGVFKLTDFESPDDFTPPAPRAPYDNALSVFKSTNPNGMWALFVVSDGASSSGVMASGWSLDITTDTPQPGSIDFSFAPPGAGANDLIRAIALQPDGKVLIGGAFTSFNGVTRSHIARLNSDGSLDLGFNNNNSGAVTGGQVYAIALLPDGKVCIGGDFTSVGGQSRNRIAALNATTGAVTQWNPNVTEGAVLALLVSGNTVYLGGDFNSVGVLPRNYIASLDASSDMVTPWNPNADGPVTSLAVSGNLVYAGGGFTNIGLLPRNRIAALDSLTGLATDWNPSADEMVSALAVSGGVVYAGGGFSSIGGQLRNRLAALDDVSGNATPWNPDANGWVYALPLVGFKSYAGGAFAFLGATSRNGIARLDAFGNPDFGFDPGSGANDWVYAVAPDGPRKIVIGGKFTTVNGIPRNHIARLHAGPTPFANFRFTSFGFGPEGFHGQLKGPPATYVLEASSNLINWEGVSTNNSSTGMVDFTDSQASDFSRRFYRAVAY